MAENEIVTRQFEENRLHLRAVAYRMLGSTTEADDAVQETWLRLTRSDSGNIQNLRAWLTTVIARVCLDMLRSRTSRREDALDTEAPEVSMNNTAANNPEQEAILADSVGVALLVILDQLPPAERLAFVLHDMFDMSFEEIAGIVGRTPAAGDEKNAAFRYRLTVGEIAANRQVVRLYFTPLSGESPSEFLAFEYVYTRK